MHGHREEIVGGNVEEALDLACVQVERQHAVGAGLGDQVRHELSPKSACGPMRGDPASHSRNRG
jgi:hypothetical protein